MRPQVIAHRGGAKLAPENTVAAFDRALSLGADGLELDVHLSRDGVAVVHHDPTLERTTNGRGPIAECTAEELAGLDAGCHFGPDRDFPFRGRGCTIPTLGEVLGRYPGVDTIIELKTADPKLAAVALAEVHRAGALEHVTLGSFHPAALAAVRAGEPRVRTGADMDEIKRELAGDMRGPRHAGRPFHTIQIPELFGGNRIMTPEFVARAHETGVSVVVWIVDAEDDIRRLLNWGVDGIITDRPDVAVPAVHHWHASRAGGYDRGPD